MKHSVLTRAAAWLLAAALTVSPALAASPSQTGDGTSSFSDVHSGDWFAPYVTALSSQGIVSGYGDGRFGPADLMGVGDTMALLLKTTGVGSLEPIPDTYYAAVYAEEAVSRGWVAREELPSDLRQPATRLFAVLLAAQIIGLAPSDEPSPFADVDDGILTALQQAGIVAGIQENGQLLFKPDGSVSRAELCTIVCKLMERSGLIHPLPAGLTVPAGMRASVGLDVSYHQGEIDWEKAAATGVEFAMLRIGGRYYGQSSGTVFEDSRFRSYMQGATDAGLDVGVYFFSQAVSVQEAEEEARFALDILKDYDFHGPVVFDWESIDNDTARTDGMDQDGVTAAAKAFCALVEQAGCQPMLYFSQETARRFYDLDQVAQYPFWVAKYSGAPDILQNFQVWQYTDKGRVDGIQGDVDLDVRLLPQ